MLHVCRKRLITYFPFSGARFGHPLPSRLDTAGQHGGATKPLHGADQPQCATQLRVPLLLPQLRAELPPVLLSQDPAGAPGLTGAERGPREELCFDGTIQRSYLRWMISCNVVMGHDRYPGLAILTWFGL